MGERDGEGREPQGNTGRNVAGDKALRDRAGSGRETSQHLKVAMPAASLWTFRFSGGLSRSCVCLPFESETVKGRIHSAGSYRT